MDFLRNLTKYSPKKFKNKSVKEILSLDSGKVPDNFFTREYAEKYAKEFANANLTDDQLNAIELLSDLKKKVEKILTKCYTETGRASKLPKGQEQAKPADQMQAKQEQAKQKHSYLSRSVQA